MCNFVTGIVSAIMIQSQFANESQKQQLPSEHSFDIVYPSLYSIKHDYDQQFNKRTIIKLKEFRKNSIFTKMPGPRGVCPQFCEFWAHNGLPRLSRPFFLSFFLSFFLLFFLSRPKRDSDAWQACSRHPGKRKQIIKDHEISEQAGGKRKQIIKDDTIIQ